jgi:hypothetical protein
MAEHRKRFLRDTASKLTHVLDDAYLGPFDTLLIAAREDPDSVESQP